MKITKLMKITKKHENYENYEKYENYENSENVRKLMSMRNECREKCKGSEIQINSETYGIDMVDLDGLHVCVLWEYRGKNLRSL